MSIHLIDTTENGCFLQVSKYIGGLIDKDENELKTDLASTRGKDFAHQAHVYCAHHQYDALFQHLLTQVPLVLTTTETPNTESCLYLICHVVPLIEPETSLTTAAVQLCDLLGETETHRPTVRLQTMLELFNTVVTPRAQMQVLLKALDYARSTRMVALAPSLHMKAEQWEREWCLTAAEAMPLFTAIAALLDLHNSPVLKKEAFVLRSKVAFNCSGIPSVDFEALKAVAHAAVLSFISNPLLFTCDLFTTKAAQALKDDKRYGPAFELVRILLHGDLKAFQAADFSEVLAEVSTSKEDCLDKMRLMALLKLCGGKEGDAVRFSEIETALEVEAGNAEAWLIRAFGKQLMDGRIDQVQECVVVRRCERSVFERHDWDRVHASLQAWKEGISSISTAMQESSLLTATSTVQPWLA